MANLTVILPRYVLGIILHDTELDAQTTLALFNNPDSGASAHYLIRKSGLVDRVVSPFFAAWHTRAADCYKPPWVIDGAGQCIISDINAVSLGIELEYLSTDHDGYTDAQYAALNELLNELYAGFGLSLDDVEAHGKVQCDRSDPRDFDWARITPVEPPPEPAPLPQPVTSLNPLVPLFGAAVLLGAAGLVVYAGGK